MGRQTRAPSIGLFSAELIELPRIYAAAFVLPVPLPAAAGRPVMVLPGFLAHDLSTARLRRSLRAAGHFVHGWGLGINLGARADLLDRLAARVRQLSDRYKRPIAMVGWSLGGVYAREVAKLVPSQVDLVVTLGSPFSGSPRANNAWRLYELLNDHPVHAPPVAVDLAAKPPVRTVALWSARDGIVPPDCAAGKDAERDAAMEVHCRHMGFVTSAAGIAAVAGVLAEG